MIGLVGLSALGLGILLGAIHYFSEDIVLAEGRMRCRVVSFAAGFSIAYLFLDLLPRTYEATVHIERMAFAFLLLGFAVFHLLEKFIYQHADPTALSQELKELHSISFFVYYFMVGIVIEDVLQTSIVEGVLFFVPVALKAGLSTASLSHIHGEVRESVWLKVGLSLSTVLGVILAMVVRIPLLVHNVLISLISGVLLYVIVREFLPEKKEGEPVFFIAGLAVFSVLSVITMLVEG